MASFTPATARRRWTWLLAAGLALVARAAAADTPMSAAAAASAPSAADSLPADSTLTLAWIERTAVARNPSLAAAHAAVQAANARAARAGALPDPTLEAMAAPRSFGSATVDPGYRIQVMQPFPLFGQRGLERRAARAEADAAAGDAATARLDLLRTAREAYFDDYRVARARATNRELIGLLGESRRIALARYAAGTTGEVDVLQAETELAMLQHESHELEQRQRMIVARLRTLLHLPQDTRLPEPPLELPAPAAPATDVWIQARMSARWPELAAADASVRARQADLALAGRERLPGFEIGAAYDRFWSETDLRTSVGASLTLPLNLGRLDAREREARAALAQAEDERAAVRDRIEQRIEEASASLALYLHDVEIMEGSVVPASERSLKAVRAAYEAGRGDFTTWLDATRALARARLELVDAQVMAHQAEAELERALATDVPAAGVGGGR